MLRALGFVLALLSPLPVVAQDAAEAIPETEEDRATEEALADEEARANFEAGRVAFAQSRYADALAYFERAHELSGRHQLLYNIGLCHDRMGNDAEALASFEGYLEAAPEAHNRVEVEGRMDAARTRIARATPETGLEPAPPPPSASVDPAPWAILGVGAAVLVGGVVLVGVGRADIDALEGTPAGARSWTDVERDVERADLLWGIGLGTILTGVALSVTGIVWGATTGGAGPSSETVSVRILPGGLSMEGTF